MNKKIYFMFLAPTFAACAIFDYDRAIVQSQKNNWPQAEQMLTQVIIENPDKPDALYDLGVAAYRNNNFETALNYFNKAANHPHAQAILQEQAHFNAGNAHEQLKQLHEAIAAYDRVLALKTDHQQALHNKEVVKKMLEQNKQDQENQDNKEQDKNQNQNQDKENNDQKQQQQNKDNKNQSDKQDQQDDQNSNQKKQNKSQDSKNQNSEQSENQANKKDNKQSEPQKQSGGPQDKDKQSAGNTNQLAEQKKESPNPAQQLSAGLARALEEREKQDAQLNKKMTKALVANQAGGKHDYNCW